MKLEIYSWNNTGATYNAKAEETAIIAYNIRHAFNAPAECIITLADAGGALIQKYNVDSDDVYVGPGKVELEDPTGTDLFFGRIYKVSYNEREATTTLFCRDWLDQLDEEQIQYDMREDLDGEGLRQSQLKTDVDGDKTPVAMILHGAVADDGGAQTAETTEANEVTADDMTLLPAVPAVNDAYYFGFSQKVPGFTLDISTQGSWVGTMIWYYSKGGGDFTASLADFTANPAAGSTFEASGRVRYTWTVPALWAKDMIQGIEAYWVKARVNSYTGITTQPKGREGGVWRVLSDDDMTFDADAFADMYVILPAEHAGEQTITTGPYDEVAYCISGMDTDAPVNAEENLWTSNGEIHQLSEADQNFNVYYYFHVLATEGSLYSAGPTGAKITFEYALAPTNTNKASEVRIYNNTTSTYKTIGYLPITESDTDYRVVTLDVPAQYLAHIVNAAGDVEIRIESHITVLTSTHFYVDRVTLEVTVLTTGSSTPMAIDSNGSNYIVVDTDCSVDGLGLWEGCPYCISKEIYKHIDSAETPGTLITDGDILQELTCAATVEHTTGISTRHFQGRTRLEILRELADADSTVFYVTLGGTTLTWKKTFNNGAPTALADSGVSGWHGCEYDYEGVVNEYDVYGVRIGDNEVFVSTGDLATDPGADSKALYGVTRSKVVRGTYLSEAEAEDAGQAMVERDEDVRFFVQASIAGLSAIWLGEEVAITSTPLNLTAANYVCNHWSYDSRTHQTTLRFHPRSSTGYQLDAQGTQIFKAQKQTVETVSKTQFIPGLTTQEW